MQWEFELTCNKNINYMRHCSILFFILYIITTSCNDGFLDKIPVDKYSDLTVWQDIELADAFLLKCYDQVILGFKGYMPLSSVTDEVYNKHMVGYLNGDLTADNVYETWEKPDNNKSHYQIGWWNYKNIQRINYFLDNIDKVIDGYSSEEVEEIQKKINTLKGEALFLRAHLYTNLCRTYGGVPLLSKSNELNDDFLSIQRSTFEQTVEFIKSDCDESYQLLPYKNQAELGRASKEAALAVKSRILLFAASDLTADNNVENEFVGYLTPNRNELWENAKEAAKKLMDLNTLEMKDLGAPDQKLIAENYFNMFKSKDLTEDWIIWGKMYREDIGSRHRWNLWMGPNGQFNWSTANITQNFVDYYQMSDGTEFFDHFKIDSLGNYINKSNTFKNDNIYIDREPRFYGSILYDGAKFQPRIETLADMDTIGIYDRKTVITVDSDGNETKRYGLDTRQGPIQEWSGSFTGYIMKKMLDDEIVGQDDYNSNAWIEYRYIEVVLNYIEACIETGDLDEGAKYINLIRNRVGLPDFTGDIMEALRYERKIELAFEDKRWFDIRRWRVLNDYLTPVYGIDITETINKAEGISTTTWTQFKAFDRGPIPKHLYWIPISREEMKKAPQLIQNPGY